MDNPKFTLRRATESDRTYLQRLNFLADAFGEEDAVIGEAELDGVAGYVDDWDPERDGGIIAFDQWRTPAGGVWLRFWPSPADGHANLGPDIPELAIAVENRFAGHRLGMDLLTAAVELAQSKEAPAVALWVDPDNTRARHRYEAFGFVDCPGVPGAMVFRCAEGD